MNHWPFIIAAYLIALGGTAVTTIISLRAVRLAEARAEEKTGRG